METVLATNDPVRLSYACALLDEAGIEHLVADTHISAIEGSIGVFPRRLMVLSEDAARAQRVLRALDNPQI